jgi:hypothetical protein
MKSKTARVIVFILYFLFWMGMVYLFVGCANPSYHTIPDAMCEDSQNYSTKYNMMDSQDSSKNPNAQLNIFGVTY